MGDMYGLLGRKLGHSFSPRIHAELGGYEYALFEREPEEVEEFLRRGGFKGINVTIPYKQTVMPFCAELSTAAEKIGSVNTIVRREDGSLYGHNTDYDGFMYMIKTSGVSVAGKKALVLGDGGAAKTVRAVLAGLGAGEIVTISRRGENNYTNLDRHADAALIVNATPVGMYPEVDAAAVNLSVFPKCKAVLDLIYNPAHTKLLLQAESLGMAAVNGLGMLVEQARCASELFTDRTIPESETARVTAVIAASTMNIALIGMPGCGKSTVGGELAARLGRRLVDMDGEIVKRAGKTIPEIFAQDGEEEFRRLETAVLADISRESGLVIATGGGVVTRPENLPLLRRNSRVVLLERPIDDLPTDGRPLSQKYTPSQLAIARAPLYNSWKEIAVRVTDPVETAEKVIKELKI
ncbi:MAG: shikimate kinase [Clostridiales bacterium]|nr:shikimate kinase [Clostridiales bacterium]